MFEEYRSLSTYIKRLNKERKLILHRCPDELSFIKKWIEDKTGLEIQNNDDLENLSLRDIILKCTKCNNIINRMPPYGSGENGIMIIENPPRLVSSIERKSLVVESKELLRKMLKAIDVDINSCYITSIIKCESSDSFCTPSLMFRNCDRILKREILYFDPQIIIVMGEYVPLMDIIKENSRIFWKGIEHPMILLRHTELKRNSWEILKQVRAKLQRDSSITNRCTEIKV
ncbi:MAG: uracil-DNA glycosylase family protein [Spirochaetota bacterium]|nr:uracil-DNA glycosylase family protein [Spirochaetota bacterium]